MVSLSGAKYFFRDLGDNFKCATTGHKISESDVMKLAKKYRENPESTAELYSNCTRCNYPFVLMTYEQAGKEKWKAVKYGEYVAMKRERKVSRD